MAKSREADGAQLVSIGSPADPMEGAMLREFLGSHGIHCLVQGEHHRSLLQGLGSYVELRLLVPLARAEKAAALVREFRAAAVADDGDDEEAESGGEVAAADEAADDVTEAREEEPGDQIETMDDVEWRGNRELRRQVDRARVISLFLPGLGLSHFAAGARRRGLALAAIWPIAIWFATRGNWTPMMISIPISTAFDIIFAPVAIRGRPAGRVPRARLIEAGAGNRARKR